METPNGGPRDKWFAGALRSRRSRSDDRAHFRGGRWFSIQTDQQERKRRSDDSHASPTRDFQEGREDDEEAHGPRDEGETLPSPSRRVVRGPAHEKHDGREDGSPFEDRDARDDSEGWPTAVEEERSHQEPEARERVGARGPW